MSFRATATGIFYIVTTTEIMNILVYGIGMITHITPAICTTDKTAENMLSCIFFLRCSAFCSCCELLYRFPSITVNDWLVNILEDFPILHRVINTGFVLEVFGIGLEIDDITTVFLLSQYLLNSSFTPLIRVRLCFLTATVQSFTLPISHGDKNLSVLQFSCNSFVTHTLKAHSVNVPDYFCSFCINYPFLFVLRRFQISVWWLR